MIKMVLGDDQLYYVSLCEDQHTIRLAITPDEDGIVSPKGRQERWELVEYFDTKLQEAVEAFMPAASIPRRYIPCSLCSQLHLKLDDARANNRPLHCINGKLPKDYYSDLRQYQGSSCTCTYLLNISYLSCLDFHESDKTEIYGTVTYT